MSTWIFKISTQNCTAGIFYCLCQDTEASVSRPRFVLSKTSNRVSQAYISRCFSPTTQFNRNLHIYLLLPSLCCLTLSRLSFPLSALKSKMCAANWHGKHVKLMGYFYPKSKAQGRGQSPFIKPCLKVRLSRDR